MGRKKGNTVVSEYLDRIEDHFAYLVETGKMSEENRKSFFEEFLGCSEFLYRSWWRAGIKRIYKAILFLLEEIKEHRERIEELEEQLNEMTKK